MKALILAAGLGTRLLPFTEKIPKPLFTLLSKPILELVIRQLADSGCEHILINTHHLHDQIEHFVSQLNTGIDIQTIHEPVILDTGGAIANARFFLEDSPFFVINSDIVSTIDLNKVFAFHQQSNCLATLVLHDHERFNKVRIDDQGFIQDFDSKTKGLAFTGVQVLSPEIYEYLPNKKVFSSIELYQGLAAQKKVMAFVEKDIYWSDIGTKASYARTSLCCLAASGFRITLDKIRDIRVDLLAGDGSDRQWYRATHENQSWILCDHGICMPESEQQLQMNAFVHIGRHLYSKGIPVPLIRDHDALSGMVLVDDLGDVHLETLVKQQKDDVLNLYQTVIDQLIDFSIKGVQGFKTEWTCQTPTYSKELIIDKECRYFMDAFVRGYMKKDLSFDDVSTEFHHIAAQALEHGFLGLMHRDMQSRNIMIHEGKPFFIDFQSARLGPLQYDLASLLIDPYVCLSDHITQALLNYTLEKLKLTPEQGRNFLLCYRYCCLTRNLQFLGAFGFLSQVKKKKRFEQYIPDAVNSLKKIITGLNTDQIPRLTQLVQTL